MPLAYIFGSATTAPTSDLDSNFQTVGLLGTLPCSVTGTNALALTLLNPTNSPTVSAYADYLIFSFVAANTNTGAVTAAVGSLGALSVYKNSSSGPVAVAAGDIIANNFYTLRYSAALNSGAGGFYLDASGLSTENESANTVFAGPTSGSAAVPGFRTLVSADLNSVRGQIPGTNTNDSASAGNVGEFLTSSIASGSAITLTSGTIGTITSLNLTPGDWDVWMEGVFGGATNTTVTNLQMALNTVSTISTLAGNFGNIVGAGQALFNYSITPTCNVGPARYSVSSTLTTLTIYALAEGIFATSSVTAFGQLRARRMR